jgi:hypothetical protein
MLKWTGSGSFLCTYHRCGMIFPSVVDPDPDPDPKLNKIKKINLTFVKAFVLRKYRYPMFFELLPTFIFFM